MALELPGSGLPEGTVLNQFIVVAEVIHPNGSRTIHLASGDHTGENLYTWTAMGLAQAGVEGFRDELNRGWEPDPHDT